MPHPLVKYDDGDEENIKAKTQYEMVKSMEEVRLTGLGYKSWQFCERITRCRSDGTLTC